MKKIILVLFTLLLVTACSNNSHYSYLSNGDDVIFTGPDSISYKRNDLYKTLKVVDADAVISDIMDRIAMKNDQINMEELEKEADEIIETYKQMGYETYLISQYGSLDAFKESYISGLLLQELAKIYVSDNYSTLNVDDKPVKMQLATFGTIEEAQQCIDDAKSGSTFDMAAANNNSTTTPSSSVYLDSDTTLEFEVKEYLNSTSDTGISSIITHTTSTTDADGNNVDTNTYYVLNIESRNPDEFKDEYIELKASTIEAETVRSYFLSNHEIEFFDQDIYKIMSENYEVFK